MSERGRHYFDWAATAIPDYREGERIYGNPSSLHREGKEARKALEEARSRCGAVLEVPPETIYFTSGGTESNALVIYSLLLKPGNGPVLCSGVEHPSVRENCLRLERLGRKCAFIGVERDGRVSGETLGKALERWPDARFVGIMGVNNETGARNDLSALSAFLRSRPGPPIHLHGDLVQAIGKVPVDLRGWDLDSASLSAHKLGGPRGVGLLYLKKPLEPLYTGGEQEKGMRPGTENPLGALALADCLERRASPGALERDSREARDRMGHLIRGLRGIGRFRMIPEDRGEEDDRFSPWILHGRFRDVPGEVMLRALDDAGFAISTGSACSSASPERPVLAAMGLDDAARIEGVRISQGWSTTLEEIDALLDAIRKALEFL